MGIEELRKKFIVDEDILRTRLEPIVTKALAYCRINKNGEVLITEPRLSAKEQLRLILAARAIAAQMDPAISADVSVVEISKYSGLPANQVRARGKDAIEDRFAESRKAGVYRAVSHKIETFLDSLAGGESKNR